MRGEGKYGWLEEAACSNMDDPIFFLMDGERLTAGRFAVAKAICGSCPVSLECEGYRRGLKPQPKAGVWSGKVFERKDADV